MFCHRDKLNMGPRLIALGGEMEAQGRAMLKGDAPATVAQSIKSLEGFDWAWVEEAQTLSDRSLELLRPTIRKPGSELWFSWNPRHASDAVDKFLRGESVPSNAVVVQANYSDNPFFTQELEDERLLDQRMKPDRYGHIWLGDYEPAWLNTKPALKN